MHQGRRRLDEVLAVVEHEEETPPPQVVAQRPLQRLALPDELAGKKPEGSHHRRDDERGVPQRCQLGQPDTVRESLDSFIGHRQGQAGLARPADAGKGDEPGPTEERGHLFLLAAPSDEAGEGGRQVVALDVLGPQRREA